MEIKVFGQLTDVFHQENISIENAADIDELKGELNRLFPDLAKKSFVIAVNRKITHQNISLKHDAEIALLPPFSGG